MVELAGDHVVRLGAAVVGFLASGCRVSEGRLFICGARAGDGGRELLAWVGSGGGESSAGAKSGLGWLGAVKAARLAPAKEAVSLAVCCTVLTGHGVALRAGSADASRCSEALVELVMVELAGDHVVRLGAAVIRLLAGGGRVSEGSLLVSGARTGDGSGEL